MWRDRILPSQTLWYKVPAGWGQQVRYDVEFANEPTVEGVSSTYSYGGTRLFTPARFPVAGGGEFSSTAMYNGRPAAIRMGSVPVAWTNRYESRSEVQPVHAGGDFYIAVTLGAKAAEIAENPGSAWCCAWRSSVTRSRAPSTEHPRRQGSPVTRRRTMAANHLWPQTAVVRAGQDGPASRPLQGRAPRSL